ncbi:guanine nucleotide-binding protein subunit alpha-12-like isoform X2 [Labeo rohita]|uniref:guanine nucleotide-binding protein subunit alpha-12-like isoform X2 n=1 Tax=Labeo rohita TaxID=84645 RepID=UPI0021E30D6F|nr:guanine nucleotide-binding protein subunit alpha-12-like isoform X2 [Labeo rohita]
MSRALNNLCECFLPYRSGARRRSREIDAMLKRDRREPMVILLTGSQYAGTTNVLRQMRLINGPVFNHKELLEFREAIYNNIIEGMLVLIQERNKLGIPLQNSPNEKHEMLFSSYHWLMKLEPCTFQPYVEAIDSLWKDSGIQEAHRRRSNFEFYESVKYYFDNIHRIGKLNYLPHNQDVIYTRNRTTFEERLHLYKIQMPLLFIIGCSDYDRTGHEDNCLVASLNDFELLCNHKSFLNSTIIIFFNKMDLLTEKVQTADIRKHFPEFQGDPQKLEDVQEFLIQSFQKRKWNNSRQIFYHMTTAVDTENIQTVFNTVKNTVMDRNLKEIPFL